jgi:hypothetical protein
MPATLRDVVLRAGVSVRTVSNVVNGYAPVSAEKTARVLAHGEPFVNTAPDGLPWSLPYRGQPYLRSEFGGIWWSPGDQFGENSWGYGQPPSSEDEWHERFAGLVNPLLDNPLMFGYCFTQLTDVFQERNGIYSLDRRAKFDVTRIRKIQSRPAAFELRPGLTA